MLGASKAQKKSKSVKDKFDFLLITAHQNQILKIVLLNQVAHNLFYANLCHYAVVCMGLNVIADSEVFFCHTQQSHTGALGSNASCYQCGQ